MIGHSVKVALSHQLHLLQLLQLPLLPLLKLFEGQHLLLLPYHLRLFKLNLFSYLLNLLF
jgi:hypothetical protein